jgi:hypothetical protein
MEKQITVAHLPHGEDRHVRIPVHYWIEKPHENAIRLHCSIRMTEGERPEWLSLHDFTIGSIYTPGYPGVTITKYGDVRLGSPKEAGLLELIDSNVRLRDPEYKDWAGHVGW